MLLQGVDVTWWWSVKCKLEDSTCFLIDLIDVGHGTESEQFFPLFQVVEERISCVDVVKDTFLDNCFVVIGSVGCL